MRTQLQICNDADYLQAHLTVIEREASSRNPSLDNARQWVTSILSQSILVAHAVVPQLFGSEGPKIRDKIS